MKRIVKLALLNFALVSFFLMTSVSTASAYVPSSRTIVGRLVRNVGKGIFAIEQDVNFRTVGEGLTLRERWVVENGESMRLTVLSPQANAQSVRLDVLYKDGKRLGPDMKGGFKSTAMPAESIEPFFHARSSKGFLDAITRSGLVPSSFPVARPAFNVNAKTQPPVTPEAFVRLGRVAGAVAYVFGEPTPAESPKAMPGVWIEQDAFLLRKLRFPSEAEVTADRHSAQAGLRFPRTRVVTWGSNTAEIRVVSVKSLSAAQAASFLNQNSFQADLKNARLPTDEQVKEFYSRFR
ncbi:MAG: hypothetical protein V4760_17750 [Bdellovibrionota bacterium]